MVTNKLNNYFKNKAEHNQVKFQRKKDIKWEQSTK